MVTLDLPLTCLVVYSFTVWFSLRKNPPWMKQLRVLLILEEKRFVTPKEREGIHRYSFLLKTSLCDCFAMSTRFPNPKSSLWLKRERKCIISECQTYVHLNRWRLTVYFSRKFLKHKCQKFNQKYQLSFNRWTLLTKVTKLSIFTQK